MRGEAGVSGELSSMLTDLSWWRRSVVVVVVGGDTQLPKEIQTAMSRDQALYLHGRAIAPPLSGVATAGDRGKGLSSHQIGREDD